MFLRAQSMSAAIRSLRFIGTWNFRSERNVNHEVSLFYTWGKLRQGKLTWFFFFFGACRASESQRLVWYLGPPDSWPTTHHPKLLQGLYPFVDGTLKFLHNMGSLASEKLLNAQLTFNNVRRLLPKRLAWFLVYAVSMQLIHFNSKTPW